MNYERIHRAIEFYKAVGYQWIDTPWVVTKEAEFATFPDSLGACYGGYLVGSAEQGFIQLMLDGRLSPGRYVSAGPCFRFADAYRTANHHAYFFKIELCDFGTEDYMPLLEHAKLFMGGEVVVTPDGLDLEWNGLEIGSYGSRTFKNYKWAYGTGLAEPRYSEAKQLCSYSTL